MGVQRIWMGKNIIREVEIMYMLPRKPLFPSDNTGTFLSDDRGLSSCKRADEWIITVPKRPVEKFLHIQVQYSFLDCWKGTLRNR